MIAGLAMSLGIDLVKAPGATGDYRTNFSSKARTLVETITDSTKGYPYGAYLRLSLYVGTHLDFYM